MRAKTATQLWNALWAGGRAGERAGRWTGRTAHPHGVNPHGVNPPRSGCSTLGPSRPPIEHMEEDWHRNLLITSTPHHHCDFKGRVVWVYQSMADSASHQLGYESRNEPRMHEVLPPSKFLFWSFPLPIFQKHEKTRVVCQLCVFWFCFGLSERTTVENACCPSFAVASPKAKKPR